MADRLTTAERSALMARCRGSGNRATELRLIALMRAGHITGWRRGSRLPGRPDFVFAARRLAVFVDGCFWHGCPAALHAAEIAPGVLGRQYLRQPGARPPGDTRAARPWLGCAADLGTCAPAGVRRPHPRAAAAGRRRQMSAVSPW